MSTSRAPSTLPDSPPDSPASDPQPWAAFMQWAAGSNQFAEHFARYARDAALLWQRTLERNEGKPVEPVVTPAPSDRRFGATEWSGNSYFDYLKQNYLLGARFLKDATDAAELDPRVKRQLAFLARQAIESYSPSNFVATNPEALSAALASGGESIRRGVEHLLDDMKRGIVSNVDANAFEVGKNLAVTPGAVVFENDLLQLIQYSPATAKVYQRPLLMVPPCINKFYVLDLQPDTSFVRYAVDQGHSVFMVSWRNPDESLAQIGWDDYIDRGVIAAIEATRAVSGEARINTLGFCVGGTLLAAAAAVLAARNKAWIESMTLLTTLLDFSDAGEIGNFVTPHAVEEREKALADGGLLSGKELRLVFAALRGGDLIWPYVVNNYLKGGTPAAFDILYWNADSTNLPGPMFTWYVRNMYLENNLCRPGATTVTGTPVDLRKVTAPAFIVATREDHIVPWQTAFKSVGLLGGANEFVLGASGHIAGIINPAAKHKRNYWIGPKPAKKTAKKTAEGTSKRPPPGADAWFDAATEVAGSWWPRWIEWLGTHAGPQKQASATLGDRTHRPIEPAPGRYVKVRID
jgi:polyhydroxyalkanoate synthase subunit PhaC